MSFITAWDISFLLVYLDDLVVSVRFTSPVFCRTPPYPHPRRLVHGQRLCQIYILQSQQERVLVVTKSMCLNEIGTFSIRRQWAVWKRGLQRQSNLVIFGEPNCLQVDAYGVKTELQLWRRGMIREKVWILFPLSDWLGLLVASTYLCFCPIWASSIYRKNSHN